MVRIDITSFSSPSTDITIIRFSSCIKGLFLPPKHIEGPYIRMSLHVSVEVPIWWGHSFATVVKKQYPFLCINIFKFCCENQSWMSCHQDELHGE